MHHLLVLADVSRGAQVSEVLKKERKKILFTFLKKHFRIWGIRILLPAILSNLGTFEWFSVDGPSGFLDSHGGYWTGGQKGLPEAASKGLARAEFGGRAQSQPPCSQKPSPAQQAESDHCGWKTTIRHRSTRSDGGVCSRSQWSGGVTEGPAGVASVSQQLLTDSGSFDGWFCS